MITSAAIKIKDLRQNKEIIIPCHRHGQVFKILKLFGYKPKIDFEVIAQGFLDEHDNFYNRKAAYIHAWMSNQIQYPGDNWQLIKDKELFSEDLW